MMLHVQFKTSVRLNQANQFFTSRRIRVVWRKGLVLGYTKPLFAEMRGIPRVGSLDIFIFIFSGCNLSQMCMSAAEDNTNPTVSLVTQDTFNIVEIIARAELLPDFKITHLRQWEV